MRASPVSHLPRAPGQEGLQDDIGEVGLLGNYLLQPLARYGQHLPTLAHHDRDVPRLPEEHVQLAHKTARALGHYDPRLAREVVDHLKRTFEDDYEVEGSVTRPGEDLPRHSFPRLPVAHEDFDLIFPQPRGGRTANLVHPIFHSATSHEACTLASIVPPALGRRILMIGDVGVAGSLKAQENFVHANFSGCTFYALG